MLNTFPVRFQQPVNTCLAFGWTSFSLLFKWFCVTFIQDICFSLALTGCNYLSYMCTIRLKCEASKTRRPVQINRFINGKAGTYFFMTSRNSAEINSYENNTDEIMQGDLAYGKWLICFFYAILHNILYKRFTFNENIRTSQYIPPEKARPPHS